MNGVNYTYYIKSIGQIAASSTWSHPARIQFQQPTTLVQFEDVRHDVEKRRIYFKWTAPNMPVHSFRILVTQMGSTYTLCSIEGQATEMVYQYENVLAHAVF
jgi:hypothetical protein